MANNLLALRRAPLEITVSFGTGEGTVVEGSQSAELLINYLADSAAADRLRFFVGSGLSAAAGYPSWRALASQVARDCGLDIDDAAAGGVTEPLVLQAARDQYANGPDSANSVLRKTFASKVHTAFKDLQRLGNKAPLPEHFSVLTSLPCSEIWTTNFDDLLESAFYGRHHVVREADLSDFPDVKAVRKLGTNGVIIFKLHGDFQCGNTQVLTLEDYDTFFEDRKLFADLLVSEMVRHTFVFLGYSFTDANIRLLRRLLYRRSQNDARPSYAVFANDPAARSEPGSTDPHFQLRSQLLRDHLLHIGVVPVTVSAVDVPSGRDAKDFVSKWLLQELVTRSLRGSDTTRRGRLQTSAIVGRAVIAEGVARSGNADPVGSRLRMLRSVPFRSEHFDNPDYFMDYPTVVALYENLRSIAPESPVSQRGARLRVGDDAVFDAGARVFSTPRLWADLARRSPVDVFLNPAGGCYPLPGSLSDRLRFLMADPETALRRLTRILHAGRVFAWFAGSAAPLKDAELPMVPMYEDELAYIRDYAASAVGGGKNVVAYWFGARSPAIRNQVLRESCLLAKGVMAGIVGWDSVSGAECGEVIEVCCTHRPVAGFRPPNPTEQPRCLFMVEWQDPA